jgi:DNA-binding LacI/PurR family transcriptional regulator
MSIASPPCPRFRSTSELAAHLGLSRWTVSRALNGHPAVQPTTRARITEAIKQSRFQPNAFARGLQGARSRLIGLVAPELESYYLTAKLSTLQEAITTRGGRALIEFTGGEVAREEEALRHFIAMRVEGLVWFGAVIPPRHPLRAELRRAKIRLIEVDPQVPIERALTTDRATAMELALRHLHQLGHRRFASLGFDPTSAYGAQRNAGLQRAAQALGIKWNKAHQAYAAHPMEGCPYALGRELVSAVVAAKPRATGILALNDRVAMGFLQGVQAAGLAVPRDFSVIGYDNAAFSAYTHPPLTTIDPQTSNLIDLILPLLFTARRWPAADCVTPTLLLRQSTQPPPPRTR